MGGLLGIRIPRALRFRYDSVISVIIVAGHNIQTSVGNSISACESSGMGGTESLL